MAELPPVDPEKAIAAIRDARPPATDRFTYLTIVEANLIPQALPALEEILQDAELTQDIGWDLVFNLATLPGSDTCLETIARLGNPREVILKVLEALELLEVPRNPDSSGDNDYSSDWSDNISAGDEYSEDDQAEQGKQDHKDETETPVPAEKKFVTFLGMLAILHQRIKTKRPSRFLAQTLQTVHSAYLYRPTPEITAAVINLVHSLSGRRRPALPSRKSSVNVANMDTPEQRGGGAPRNAPDPEAEEDTDQAAVDDSEADEALQQRMLLSFVTCVLERYAEEHDMDWAARLLEFYEPEKLVPGRKTLMGAFREEQKLLERDAVVGQLVALIRDLGLNSFSKTFLDQLLKGPFTSNPLSTADSAAAPEDIALSTGGCVLLIAYWVFSATVFDADQPVPEMHIFPDHFDFLNKLLADDPEAQIQNSPALAEGLVAIGLWLKAKDKISPSPDNESLLRPDPTAESGDDAPSGYMRCLHLITLVALYHPRLHVRNAASVLAGHIFHADPSDNDRLRILYDLLENCGFASLKARAVTWLRDEILSASQNAGGDKDAEPSAFASREALEMLQYVVFPNLRSLNNLDFTELAEYFGQNIAFILQAANFGLFLWWTTHRWAHVLPANADATVKERWFRPLNAAVDRLRKSIVGGGELIGAGPGGEGEERLGPLAKDLDVLAERLADLKTADGFNVAEERERA